MSTETIFDDDIEPRDVKVWLLPPIPKISGESPGRVVWSQLELESDGQSLDPNAIPQVVPSLRHPFRSFHFLPLALTIWTKTMVCFHLRIFSDKFAFPRHGLTSGRRIRLIRTTLGGRCARARARAARCAAEVGGSARRTGRGHETAWGVKPTECLSYVGLEICVFFMCIYNLLLWYMLLDFAAGSPSGDNDSRDFPKKLVQGGFSNLTIWFKRNNTKDI